MLITDNTSLEALDSFNDLSNIGVTLYIYNNSINTIEGFKSLKRVKFISLHYNDNLTFVSGFKELEWIEDSIFQSYNKMLNCEGLCVFYGKANEYYFSFPCSSDLFFDTCTNTNY